MTSKPDLRILQRPSSNALGLKFPVLDWFQRLTRRLGIGTKISCGYALALGIAVVGTTGGLTIGEYYHKQAIKQEEDAREEIRLISSLERTLLQVVTHKHQLIYSVKKPENWHVKYANLLENMAKVNQLWAEFRSTEGLTKNSEIEELPAEIKLVKRMSKDYKGFLENYLIETEKILQEIDRSDWELEKFNAAQKRLLNLNQSPLAFKIDHLSDDLADLIKLADEDYEKAKSKGLLAEGFRVQIIIISILLSVIIATILALYTSRAIAHPIRSLTAIAQQVAQETNFDLQAPVTTEDEVGRLAVSLNTLIRRVAAHTQELLQKNQQLLQAHEELNQTLQNLRQTQAQLIQSEKMSSLGQMVAGVAHEINNPVNFISNNLEYTKNYTQDLLELVQLYQQQYPIPTSTIQDKTEAIELDFLVQDLPKTLSSMKMGAERMCQLAVSLRNFSRLDEAEMKPVNIHEGIDNTLLILYHQIKHGIEVVKQYGDLPLVECYPAQLNQVFMNILQNAIDALQDEADRPNKQIVIKTQTVAPNQIQVQILDNGSGIPVEVKNNIFEPFFTTKIVGKGTGLGLAISYQIINKHQGKIEVISQSNQGTEFVIELPIKQLTAATAVPNERPKNQLKAEV